MKKKIKIKLICLHYLQFSWKYYDANAWIYSYIVKNQGFLKALVDFIMVGS